MACGQRGAVSRSPVRQISGATVNSLLGAPGLFVPLGLLSEATLFLQERVRSPLAYGSRRSEGMSAHPPAHPQASPHFHMVGPHHKDTVPYTGSATAGATRHKETHGGTGRLCAGLLRVGGNREQTAHGAARGTHACKTKKSFHTHFPLEQGNPSVSSLPCTSNDHRPRCF